MSGGRGLEQRYRRVLRLLPGYYREAWQEDMVAAFLDTWMTGDPDEDSVTMEFDRPGWREVVSVAALAGRLYLGGVGAARRYFAWGQAVRRAVLALVLVHAMVSLNALVFLTWSRRLFGLPAPPASLAAATPDGIWPSVWYAGYYAWIVVFVVLVLGHYRAARVIAVLAIIPDLIRLLDGQFTDRFTAAPIGPWAFWILLNFVPVLAMTAFHRNAPPVARRPWLLALRAMHPKPFLPSGGCPAGYAKVAVSNGACFAQTGTPVTITSATISPVFSPPATSPAGQPPPPAQYGFTITLSPAEVPELTAVTTTAADDQGPLALSVDGRTWVLPMVTQPFTSRQFMISLPTKDQAVQLQRLLVMPG